MNKLNVLSLAVLILFFFGCSEKSTNYVTPSPENVAYETLSPVMIKGTLSLLEISAIEKETPARVRTALSGTSPVDIPATYLELIPSGYLLCSMNSPAASGMSGSPLLISTPEGWKIAGALSMAPTYERHSPFYFLATPLEEMQNIRKSQLPSRLKIEDVEFSSLPMLYALSGAQPVRHAIISDNISEKSSTLLRPAFLSLFPDYELLPGTPVAVSLIRGDIINLSAVGTVTWKEDNKIWLFGHSFLWEGETQMPLVGANTHAIFTSLYLPYKYSSVDKKVKGTVIQDRAAGLLANLDTLPAELKVQTIVQTPSKNYTHYLPYMRTSSLLGFYTAYAASIPLDNVRDNISPGSIGGQVKIKFKETDKEVDYQQFFASGDPVYSWLYGINSLLDNFLQNNVAKATPTQIEFLVHTLTNDIRKIRITTISAPSSIGRGSTLNILVSFLPYQTPSEITENYALPIPADFPTGSATLMVLSRANCPSINTPLSPNNLGELITKVNSESTNSKIAIKLEGPLGEIAEKCIFVDYEVEGEAQREVSISD